MLKTFIIRLSDNPISKGFAEDAYQSVLDAGLSPEFYEGVNAHESHQFLINKGLKMAGEESLGTIGCFSSHYSLWEKCTQLNEPIVVLEHDGVMLHNPTPLLDKVKDVCHLDPHLVFNSSWGESSNEYSRHVYSDLTTEDKGLGVVRYPERHFYGSLDTTGYHFVQAYGYIVTPLGAKKLIDFAKAFGVFPADKAICENAARIETSLSTFVRYNPALDTIEKQRRWSTR